MDKKKGLFCPTCKSSFELTPANSKSQITCNHCGSVFTLADLKENLPKESLISRELSIVETVVIFSIAVAAYVLGGKYGTSIFLAFFLLVVIATIIYCIFLPRKVMLMDTRGIMQRTINGLHDQEKMKELGLDPQNDEDVFLYIAKNKDKDKYGNCVVICFGIFLLLITIFLLYNFIVWGMFD